MSTKLEKNKLHCSNALKLFSAYDVGINLYIF